MHCAVTYQEHGMPTRNDDKKLDKTVEDSFPASDPAASSGIVGPRIQHPDEGKPAGRKDSEAGRKRDRQPAGGAAAS